VNLDEKFALSHKKISATEILHDIENIFNKHIYLASRSFLSSRCNARAFVLVMPMKEHDVLQAKTMEEIKCTAGLESNPLEPALQYFSRKSPIC
jgi:hypothetical protein